MGNYWLWYGILFGVLVLVIPLCVRIVRALRRAGKKVKTILHEELDSPEDPVPPTPSGDGPDRDS